MVLLEHGLPFAFLMYHLERVPLLLQVLLLQLVHMLQWQLRQEQLFAIETLFDQVCRQDTPWRTYTPIYELAFRLMFYLSL